VTRLPRQARTLAAAVVCLLAAGCAQHPVHVRQPAPVIGEDTALHNRLPTAIRQGGVLRIATDASYAPASSFASDGHTIVGFEPDLGQALGQVLGVAVVFTNHSFDSLPGLVTSHSVDLVMSAVTDTREREKEVDFIDYFVAGTSIVVQRGNPKGIGELSALCGHVVALERGTVQVGLVARSQHNCLGRPIITRLYDNNTDALVQVRTGRADAQLSDYPSAAALVNDARTGAYYQLASTAQYEPGPYGIAVAKDNQALRGAVADALRWLVSSGQYRQILRRWGVEAGAISRVSLNAGGGRSCQPPTTASSTGVSRACPPGLSCGTPCNAARTEARTRAAQTATSKTSSSPSRSSHCSPTCRSPCSLTSSRDGRLSGLMVARTVRTAGSAVARWSRAARAARP